MVMSIAVWLITMINSLHYKGWQKFARPWECNHQRCYAGCDIDWATKWVFQENTKNPTTIEAQAFQVNPQDGIYWAKQSFDTPLKNMVHIVWAPTLFCNYDCRYCGCAVGAHDIKKDFVSSFSELSVQQWLKVWDEIIENYDFAIVDVTGGEPLLSAATVPVISRITKKFAIGITTNLSKNVFELVRDLPKAQDTKAGIKLITASLHPTARGFNRDLFLGSVLYLKNNGIPVAVNFVGHPLQLFLAQEYKRWCKRHGVNFFLSSWCGKDNDGFEASYTQAELAYFNRVAPSHRKTWTQTEFFDLRYKLWLKDKISDIKCSSQDQIILRGRVVNTGDRSWLNQGLTSEAAFKVGARLFGVGETKKALREFRASLPAEEIIPQKEYNFSMNLNFSGLAVGKYILVIDMLKEGSFWFAEKKASPLEIPVEITETDPVSRYLSEVVEVKIPNIIYSNTETKAHLKIKNCGTSSWFRPYSSDNIKVGCRIFEADKKEAIALREFRVCPNFVVPPREVFETEIILDLNGLKKGEYIFVFDMVNEHKFWFEERGSKPIKTKIRIVHKSNI